MKSLRVAAAAKKPRARGTMGGGACESRAALALSSLVLLGTVLPWPAHALPLAPTPTVAASAPAVPTARIRREPNGDHVIELPAAVAVQGAPGCASATLLRVKVPAGGREAATPEYVAAATLVTVAQRSGRKLLVSGGRCMGGGVVEAAAVSVEPDPKGTLDCTAPGRARDLAACARPPR